MTIEIKTNVEKSVDFYLMEFGKKYTYLKGATVFTLTLSSVQPLTYIYRIVYSQHNYYRTIYCKLI